jgi:hypothetical protein
MTTLTNQQRAQREKEVRELLDQGLSARQIGMKIGTSQQAVLSFIKLRGWETEFMASQTSDPGPKAGAKRARVEKRKAMGNTVVDSPGIVEDKGEPK